jgi:uncharacterized protein (TIGR00645 family)
MDGPRNSWVEDALEHVLFASRWLMAPFYLGLAMSLLVLIGIFIYEIVHVFPKLLDLQSEKIETDVLLWVLSLIDLSLAANLVVMVVLAGYENFVSKMEVANHPDRPDWMGKIDFSGMKLKLIASIVAISAIYLLRAFMSIENYTQEQLTWLVIIHLVFVGSGVLLALMDYIAEKGHAVHAAHANKQPPVHAGQP